MLRFPARKIQTQPAPANAGTKHRAFVQDLVYAELPYNGAVDLLASVGNMVKH